MKEVPKLATEDEVLDEGEEAIRKLAESYRTDRDTFEKTEAALIKAVHDYRGKREYFQRGDYANKGLGWCQECEEAYPEKTVVLLYTEGVEQHGSEYSEYGAFERRLRSFCNKCAEIVLSFPRGGEDKSQCFVAEKRGKEFFIFVSGKWRLIEKLEEVTINIEREDIPEGEYAFGKNIDYDSSPFELTIDEERVV